MSNSVPRRYVQELTGTDGLSCPFHLVEVKGSTFLMGSEDKDTYREKPAHSVIVSDFWMGEYIVTQALWKAVMGEENAPFRFKGEERPAEWVSWDMINDEFLSRLNNMTGENYRLPTEAEWEYAARGGIHASPYQYAGSNRLEDVGWCAVNSHRETKPVGLKKPNALGLYDLSGNVYEWCFDWWSDGDYYRKCKNEGIVDNPTGPARGGARVVRGGCWNGLSLNCRVSRRGSYDPQDVYSLVGFRLVVSVLQSAGWEKRLKTHEQKRKIK